MYRTKDWGGMALAHLVSFKFDYILSLPTVDPYTDHIRMLLRK